MNTVTTRESKMLGDRYVCVKHPSRSDDSDLPQGKDAQHLRGVRHALRLDRQGVQAQRRAAGSRGHAGGHRAFPRASSRARTATPSRVTRKSAPPQTPIPLSRRRATCSPARRTRKKRSRSCSTSSSRRTSRRRPSRRSRASSGRKSRCTTMTPSGASCSTCCAPCTTTTRSRTTLQAPWRALRRSRRSTSTAATIRFTT